MILGTIVPNNYFMPFQAVTCWFKIRNLPIVYGQGPDLDYNRNIVFERAREANDHFLMIDSDIIFTVDDVYKINELLDQGHDAVTGVYPVGTPPYPPCIFERIPGDYKLTKVQPGIKEIGACGGGFLGINRNVMEKMTHNPFDNIQEGDIFHGEDISFCYRLHEQGFKLWCDSSIKLGHVRTTTIY